MSTNEIDFLSILVSFAEKIDNDTNKNKQDPVVYMAENPKTQEYYFGATSQRKARRDKHINQLKAGTHINKRFQEAYNKDPSFIWKELSVIDSKTAFDIEKELIKECRSDSKCLNIKGGCGYNPEKYIKIGLSNLGKHHSEETKKHLSQTSKKYWSDPEIRKEQSEKRKQYFENGGIPYQLGMKRSDEFCEKVSEGKRKYWESLSDTERNELNKKKSIRNAKNSNCT